MATVVSTPREDGFAMPPEWGPHQATLISWPTTTRRELWGERFEAAKRDHAEVVRAVAAFEAVIVLADPSQEREARDACGTSNVEVVPVPLDDSWIRDNGPIFVTNDTGEVALVHFGFNSWGERFLPYDRDARVPEAIAAHLGVRRYVAPMILEGGSFFVDGEGTLLTTEQCLLNPNRNPALSREDIERVLSDFLAADRVLWLPFGWSASRDTDGHVDGIAQYAGPGRVILLAPADPADPDQERGAINRKVLETTEDARGRRIEVVAFDPGEPAEIPYLNVYLVNGGVIAPVVGGPPDEVALEQVRAAFPERELVTVPGEVLHEGGGGPHCITQQVPFGKPVA
jgi:agmatine deiminase